MRAPEDVAAVHGAADAALIAMGTTLWELLARGVPTAVVALDEVHRRLVDAVVAGGAALDAGDAGATSSWSERLPALLGRLADPQARSELSAAARSLVDGEGADRVLAALVERHDHA